MSANTSISEGGKARPFGPVKILMVQGEDGKYYPWFPESDRELDNLSVDKNGVYRASDIDVYGWGNVSVNVQADHVTGRNTDTGDEVVVKTNSATGELIETVVPVEIRVIIPPTKTEYLDGETIDCSGMIVKAYGANGEEMQIVPLDEVTINPTIAEYDESTVEKYDTAVSSLETNPWTKPIKICKKLKWTNEDGTIFELDLDSPDYRQYNFTITCAFVKDNRPAYPDKTMLYVLVASKAAKRIYVDVTFHEGGKRTEQYSVSWGRTSDGKDIALAQFYEWDIVEVLEGAVSQRETNTAYGYIQNAAWTMVDGEITPASGMSKQSISVTWPRPADGAILETHLDITVAVGGD